MQVCIIGAGAAGITAAKHLLEKGFEVELLEKRDGLGGLWYFGKDSTGVTKETFATSSKTYLQFSDFPFKPEVPHFPHHTDYIKYLKSYAEKHNIVPLIKFNREVVNLRKNGKVWEITVRHGKETYTETKDAVVVSSGLHHIPSMPTIPGKEKYQGLEAHSGLVKTGDELKGKRVVVIGLGESGADFAHYLTSFASEVYLSVRRGAVILPRWVSEKIPADFDSTRAKGWLPREFIHDYNTGCYPGFPIRQYSAFRTFFTLLSLPVWLASLPFSFNNAFDFIKSLFDWKMWAALFQKQQRHGSPSGIELSKACAELCQDAPPTEEEAENRFWKLTAIFAWHSGAMFNSQSFTKSADFLRDIVAQKVTVVPGISQYNGGLEVEFEDGSKREIDAVIMCTGYQAMLPFLQEQEIDNSTLYKHVFIPGESTLAFIGFARPNVGALPPVTEMQSRWFSRVLAGELSLPSAVEMKKVAEMDGKKAAEKKKAYAKRTILSAAVDYQMYMNELGGLIGCRPNLFQLLGRPKLLFAVLFGPFASYQYRLNGDGANLEAAMEVVSNLPPYPTDRVARDISLLFLVKPWFILLSKLGFKRFEPIL
jgi:thioredoxin reductase